MAISSYIGKNGEVLWKAAVCVRSRVDSTVRVQRAKFGLKSEQEAEKEMNLLFREGERAVALKENQGSTWGKVVEEWELFLKNDVSMNPDTRDDYVRVLVNYTSKWWGRRAADITTTEVRSLIHQIKAQGASNSFQNKMKHTINRVFTFGIESRLIKGIQVSPTFGIKIGRKEEKKPEILTIAEIRKFLVQARLLNHPWYSVWATALLTGMRSGELYALLWTDIDWENEMISVNKSYNGRRNCVKSTKSGEYRDVPISSELMTLLKELKLQAGGRPEVLPRFWEWRKGQQANVLRLFCFGVGIPSIKFHTLRACFATQLLRNSVAPAQVQKICGWKNLETMQRYIRLAGIEVKGATESLRIMPEAEVMAKVVNLFTPEPQ